jgi:hypothetical protein
VPPWQLSSTWLPTHRESEGETDVGVGVGVAFRVDSVGVVLLDGEDVDLPFVLEDLVVSDILLDIELLDGFKEFDVPVLLPGPVLDAVLDSVPLDVELPVFVAAVK